MLTMTRRRVVVLAAVVCAGLGAGGVLAVQASASADGGSARSVPTAPKAPTRPDLSKRPPVRPMTANGQVVPDVTATNVRCGQTLTASVTLNGDLFCPGGNALIIAKSSVVLNLNGHEIGSTVSGAGIGVEVSGTSDTVDNGLITGFGYGVQVFGATDTISAVRATYNRTGIFEAGTGVKLTNDVAAQNTFNGISSGGSGTVLTGDHDVSNGLPTGVYGLLLDGSKQTVTSNTAGGNGFGIYDGGFGTTLKTDTANFNHNDGIYVSEVDVIDGGGNLAKGNDYDSGQSPEQCYEVVCT
jgi:hypothetical protein